MELTTPQIYALFAIAAAIAVLIGISYCAGLKTGRKSADDLIRHQEKLNDRNRTALIKRTADLAETNRTLDGREADLSKLRQCLREEQADHDKLTKHLQEALAREVANRLTHDDWLMLKLAAKQLGIVAGQFTKSGSNKTNQAALAQSRIHDIADRVKEALDEVPLLLSPAEHGMSDTDLIEWLEREAVLDSDGEYGDYRFDLVMPKPLPGIEHARDVLTLAVQQQRQRDYGQAMGAAA